MAAAKRKVIIVGSGAGGLALAARLAHAGLAVTVYEKNSFSGGRCSLIHHDGHRFDQGPSLLLLRPLFDQTYREVGHDIEQHLDLRKCDPNYVVWYHDGEKVVLSSDRAVMGRELTKWEGLEGPERLEGFLQEASVHAALSYTLVLSKTFYSLLNLLRPSFVSNVVRLHAFGSLYGRCARWFRTERMRRAFSFGSMYLGSSPFDSPGVYSLLQWTETCEGIWYPIGGFHRVMSTLQSIASSRGAQFHFNTPVRTVTYDSSGRATGVLLENGQRDEADIVVVNADLVWAHNNLFTKEGLVGADGSLVEKASAGVWEKKGAGRGGPGQWKEGAVEREAGELLNPNLARRLENKPHSCSSISFYWAMDSIIPELNAHNIFLAEDYKGSFDDIFKRKSMPREPSFYVNVPSRIDPSAAPKGKDTIVVLVPVGHLLPNRKDGKINADGIESQDWPGLVERARAQVIETMEGRLGLKGLRGRITWEETNTPLSWKEKFNLTHGSILGITHDFFNVLAFRQQARHPTMKNAYFVGASAHPGTGVPIAMAGARLCTEAILSDLGIPLPQTYSPLQPVHKSALDTQQRRPLYYRLEDLVSLLLPYAFGGLLVALFGLGWLYSTGRLDQATSANPVISFKDQTVQRMQDQAQALRNGGPWMELGNLATPFSLAWLAVALFSVWKLLNRRNDAILQTGSLKADVQNETVHSHLYRIVTPSRSDFLDFGNVVVNAPSVRSIQFDNIASASLTLELSASQPEDIQMFVKAEDASSEEKDKFDLVRHRGKYAEEHDVDIGDTITSRDGGEKASRRENKERFMETLRELESRKEKGKEDAEGLAAVLPVNGKVKKSEKKDKPKASDQASDDKPTLPDKPVEMAVGTALKRGGRGRPVTLYDNAVAFKDRHLLQPHEYLDLASGPPVAPHRTSPGNRKMRELADIVAADRTKLSGRSGEKGLGKLDFAKEAKKMGSLGKEGREGKPKRRTPTSAGPDKSAQPDGEAIQVDDVFSSPTSYKSPETPAMPPAPPQQDVVPVDLAKPPAPTAKRESKKATEAGTSKPAQDVAALSVDELLSALETHDNLRARIARSSPTLEEEEAFVRRSIALRKQLQALIASGRLVPARTISIPTNGLRNLVVVMTPNGSIRPHVTTKPKRADSRIFVKVVDFDQSSLSRSEGGDPGAHLPTLPTRDLMVRSSCVRSILAVQQSSINFGQCPKGSSHQKTIVIQNTSDCPALFRLRTSGNIASGDLKLGLGRYGIISPYGRREVQNFRFEPSMNGEYRESISVENVLDGWNEVKVSVKANVRRLPAFTLEPAAVIFELGTDASGESVKELCLTNVSKSERTFMVEVRAAASGSSSAPATTSSSSAASSLPILLSLDASEPSTALSKVEEEEVEQLLQKLKINRRKGKADKVAKYEKRLAELGLLPAATAAPDEDGEEAKVKSSKSLERTDTIDSSYDPGRPGLPRSDTLAPGENDDAHGTGAPTSAQDKVVLLTLTLAPNQKNRIRVHLVSRAEGAEASIKVWDRKNTDETTSIPVTVVAAGAKVQDAQAGPPPNGSAVTDPVTLVTVSAAADGLHHLLMRRCLDLTLNCDVSPTAFCVGSLLFLPSTSPLISILSPHFPHVPSSGPLAGLVVAEGWSRQIAGNTHAEANALTNFETVYAALLAAHPGLPTAENALRELECYATMEPCSVRTSGGPSCALGLVRAKVRRVYLGVEEPADFVQCEGVRVLEQGGVEVVRLKGLEEECLKAARRGRDGKE